MAISPMLTLLSDFGSIDIYVGVMKGVIAQINPTLRVVDLTHEIPPQNITAARFCLMNAYPYFPDGTVHVAVVDPGVGSDRRAVALRVRYGNNTEALFVGPDNGLFSGIVSEVSEVTAVELTNPNFWRTSTPSKTFHGRDIFSSVGAHLASGIPLEQVGQAINPTTLVQLDIPECTQTGNQITGYIQYVDRFGNLITNIPGTLVEGHNWYVEAYGLPIPGCQTYADQPSGSVLALVGSHGWVEIAVSGGSSQFQLQLDFGAQVQAILG